MATEFLALDMRRAGARRFCSTSRPLRLPASPFGKRPSHPPCRLDSNPKASARMSQDGDLEDRASGYSGANKARLRRPRGRERHGRGDPTRLAEDRLQVYPRGLAPPGHHRPQGCEDPPARVLLWRERDHVYVESARDRPGHQRPPCNPACR